MVFAQPHFSSDVPMVSPAQGTGNQHFHQVSAQPCPSAALLSCSRVQGQGLVNREVISECFIERQTCTIRSKFSVSLDGDLTSIFLLTRGWEVAYEFCSSHNLKKSFSMVKLLRRSFTVHVVLMTSMIHVLTAVKCKKPKLP